MSRPTRKCPKCGAVLKYEEIMKGGVVFPCPACQTQITIPSYYANLILVGVIAVPVLVFAALGLSWPLVILSTLVVFYPLLSWSARYMKYVIPPKIKIYVPYQPHYYTLPWRNKITTLNLRDRPRP